MLSCRNQLVLETLLFRAVYQLFPFVLDICNILSNENLEEDERERRVNVILTTKKTQFEIP